MKFQVVNLKSVTKRYISRSRYEFARGWLQAFHQEGICNAIPPLESLPPGTLEAHGVSTGVARQYPCKGGLKPRREMVFVHLRGLFRISMTVCGDFFMNCQKPLFKRDEK